MEHDPKDEDYLFKIVLLGDSGVGKTSFMMRFISNVYSENISTLSDFKIKRIISSETNKGIDVQMWDRHSSEKYPTLPAAYYRGAHGLILFVDLTDRSCFEHLMDQVKNIKLYALKTTKVILIGSKCDDIEHRKLTYEEIKQFADNVGFPYIETSAKENTNIEKAVDMLVVSIERDIGEIESDRQKNLNP